MDEYKQPPGRSPTRRFRVPLEVGWNPGITLNLRPLGWIPRVAGGLWTSFWMEKGAHRDAPGQVQGLTAVLSRF